MEKEAELLKARTCKYADICPYHHGGWGCVRKYQADWMAECDFVQKMDLREEGL